MKTRYAEVFPYLTRDGSAIRELMHPAVHGGRNQSLAEAVIPAGDRTQLHFHRLTEEIYHVTAGSGVMRLGDTQFVIAPGDTILIKPGTAHCVVATGEVPLHILCSCAPAYSHEDTILVDDDPDSTAKPR
ncbi:MAG TPA: cupin domain-containing protein [Rhodocyclaceae bacterium]